MILSVIVPAYNCEKYIEYCIDSVMKQDIDKGEYEVIIINDGSTDNTKQICEKLQTVYDNIRLINIENHGLSYARNKGIELSIGEYIEFVDADDYIAHNIYNKLSTITKDTKADIIYFGNKGVSVYDDYSFDENKKMKIYNSSQECFAYEGINNGAWTYWIKKSFINDCNLRFIRGRYCEDTMFTCEMFAKGGVTVFWDVEAYRYVRNQNSITTKKERNHQKKMIEDFEFCVHFLNQLYTDMSEKTQNKKYLAALEERMGSFIFFLQLRILRYGDYNIGKDIIYRLAYDNLLPYYWKPYKNLKLVYKLFNNKILYLFMLRIMGLINKIKKV